ncbi:hypothetical protein JB92DRAFT_3136078 [Gautieria morchelliformis]|nr:hypothetical protein JB92DRAFT_3136078 [Gautieria morchelliformis]
MAPSPFPASVSLYDQARPLSLQASPAPCASTNKPNPTTIRRTSPKPPTTATTSPGGGLSKHLLMASPKSSRRDTAPVSSLGPLPVLPCEQGIDIPDNRHTTTLAMSAAETPWNVHGNEDTHLEMLTEVVDGEADEEIQPALDQPARTHNNPLIDPKRLLEQTQTASAAQFRALKAERRLLRATVEQEGAAARENELRGGHECSSSRPAAPTTTAPPGTSLAQHGHGNFNYADY